METPQAPQVPQENQQSLFSSFGYLIKAGFHTALAGCSFIFFTSYLKDDIKYTLEMKKLKKSMNEVVEYNPDELINKLDNLYKSDKRFSDRNLSQYIDCGKYFVRGTVGCSQPLNSFKNQDVKLIYSNFSIYDLEAKVNEVHENKVLKQYKILKSSTQQYVNLFELNSIGSDSEKKQSNCIVQNLRKSKIGKASQFIASEETSVFSNINLAALGVGSIVKIGFDQNEFGIKVGDNITVYGKVLYDQINKIIKLDNPENILVNKQEYQNYITQFTGTTVCVIIFGTLFVYEVYNLGSALKNLFFGSSKKN